ncbi:MAG: hypothetical protein KDD47_15695, partial [Acidobacteria bacterium]|nr:hypothetical protein [Acidobacteriota bacterium]
MSHRPILLSLLFALVLVAVPAAALTYVPMEDGALADSAGVIAEVRVIDSSFARVGGRPYTDYQLEVDRVVKGGVSGSTLVVRVPGGRAPSGLSLEIQGAPRFRAGERALVFLSASEDGTYRLTQLSLSLFHIVDQGGQTYAARNLQGAHAMAMPGRRTPVRDGLRDYTEFRRWLEDRAVGLRTNADYFREVPTGTLQAIVDRFTLFEDGGTGLNFRWQEFDTGDPVTFFAHEGGQPGLTGGGFQEFQDSLAAWNADPGSSINLQYGGTTSLTGGLTLP